MNIKTIIKENRPLVVGVFILFIGFFLFKFFSSLAETPKPKTQDNIRRIVKAVSVKYTSTPVQPEAFGRIVSASPITISAEVNGLLQKGDIPFLPGQKFRKNDVLIRIDDREVKYNLMSAKSQLLNALATLLPELKIEFPEEYKIWQRYFDNFDFKGKVRQLPEAANPRIKLFLARFNVYQLYFNVKNLEILLDKHTIRAPFRGAVKTALLRPGASARIGAVIGEILDTERREAEIPVPVRDRRWIRIGDKVTVYSEDGSAQTSGTVSRIGSHINSATETITVYIRLNKNDDSIAVGQFVKVVFPPNYLDHAITVPEKSVYNDQYVFVVKDGKLRKTPVSVAYHHKGMMIVTSGPAENDTLVVQSLQGVSDGLPVRVKLEGNER